MGFVEGKDVNGRFFARGVRSLKVAAQLRKEGVFMGEFHSGAVGTSSVDWLTFKFSCHLFLVFFACAVQTTDA
jgi:hypothetical protein